MTNPRLRRRRLPVLLVGALGFAAAVLAAVAAGRAYTLGSLPPTHWLGLLASHGLPRGGTSTWAVLLWVGITTLSVSWLLALLLARRGAITPRGGWTIAGCWALPLAVGPPAVSKDIYFYTAQGLLLHHRVDVYRNGPAALRHVGGAGALRALRAVDPIWRHTPSAYGPVASQLQQFAGSTGGPVFALIVLRLVAALSCVAIALLCVALASPERRCPVLVLVAMNPVLLIHGVSGAHVDALLCALLCGALLAARRSVWWLAVVLAVLAGLVKAPVLLTVVLVIAWHALDSPRERRLRCVVIDSAIAVVTASEVTATVPDGWGWIRNLTVVGKGGATSSITGNLAKLAGLVDPAGRPLVVAVGALAALGTVVWLGATFRRRRPAESLGWALLVVAFLAPITYPWYALWGLVCLLPTVRGRRLTMVVALCVAEAGFSIPTGNARVLTPLVTLVVVASLAAMVGLASRRGDAWRDRGPVADGVDPPDTVRDQSRTKRRPPDPDRPGYMARAPEPRR